MSVDCYVRFPDLVPTLGTSWGIERAYAHYLVTRQTRGNMMRSSMIPPVRTN